MMQKINLLRQKIKEQHPLLLNITNHVTIDFIANGLLSLGASPVMSYAPEEAEDLVNIANAVVINPGTLNASFLQECHAVCEVAKKYKKPIILDPVGVGASTYRTQHNQALMEKYQPTIIRGNASEIMALAGFHHTTKGVDSTAESTAAIDAAQTLAERYNSTIVISGPIDHIITSQKTASFTYGSPLMPKITGTGCLLTAVIAAFHAVEPDAYEAASAGTVFYGIAGELAAQRSQGPGSFKMHFIDTLSGDIPHEYYH